MPTGSQLDSGPGCCQANEAEARSYCPSLSCVICNDYASFEMGGIVVLLQNPGTHALMGKDALTFLEQGLAQNRCVLLLSYIPSNSALFVFEITLEPC